MLEAHYNKAYIILLKGDTMSACKDLKNLLDKNYMTASTLYDMHCKSEHE